MLEDINANYARKLVMKPSYIRKRLEALARQFSAAAWIYYSPNISSQESVRAARTMRRAERKLERYKRIERNGGMESYFSQLEYASFMDYVREVDRKMSGPSFPVSDMKAEGDTLVIC